MFSDPHKHINTSCGQNVGFVNVQPTDTQSDHWALRDNFYIVIYIYLHNKRVKHVIKTARFQSPQSPQSPYCAQHTTESLKSKRLSFGGKRTLNLGECKIKNW